MGYCPREAFWEPKVPQKNVIDVYKRQEEGRFRQTGGSMELPRPEGAPEVFVLAGGGSGRAVFWQLQRAGTTFAAGIVSERCV